MNTGTVFFYKMQTISNILFFCALLLMVGGYALHTIFRLKKKLKLETQHCEQQIRLLADISHDISSTLTMIADPVDDLIRDRNTPPRIRRQLELVARNTQRMLHMLNHTADDDEQPQPLRSDPCAEQNTFAPQQPNIKSHDEDFMKKVMQEIERNMDNENYSIDTMASKIGVSRTLLLKKIKGLTGCTPVEFIRDIKLQRAAQLLATRQLSVKEVMYQVGMNDVKYFRECFRKKYGKNPSEYTM